MPELEAAANDAFLAFEKGDFRPALQGEWHATLDARDRARFGAWGPWRPNLARGKFVPCIRDPDNNVILELDKKGWAGSQGLGPYCSIDDFVCPDDPIVPGPFAAIGGKLRPVFFVKNTFEAALVRAGQFLTAVGSAGDEGLSMIESRSRELYWS